MFQSAPLTEARGDPVSRRISVTPYSFNPLPLPKQGEMPVARSGPENPWVSIRSPYRSKGRFARKSDEQDDTKFQSAPLTEARGDLRGVCHCKHQCCFNPLPLPKQGEIRYEVCTISALYWFQSAPLTEARGDAVAAVVVALVLMFQSAPLTEARGDASIRLIVDRSFQFQSAPLTEARGDS